MTKKTKNINFEKSLDELEKLVTNLEKGDLPLEKSLSEFERGIGLSKQCQEALANAEQKVQVLSQEKILEPFDTPYE
jgi:exodeoxyribonuclease VII small subunit